MPKKQKSLYVWRKKSIALYESHTSLSEPLIRVGMLRGAGSQYQILILVENKSFLRTSYAKPTKKFKVQNG